MSQIEMSTLFNNIFCKFTSDGSNLEDEHEILVLPTRICGFIFNWIQGHEN